MKKKLFARKIFPQFILSFFNSKYMVIKCNRSSFAEVFRDEFTVFHILFVYMRFGI